MMVRHELTNNYGLISLMKIFGRTKSLKDILRRLKSNVGIFKDVFYLFNPIYLNNFFKIVWASPTP